MTPISTMAGLLLVGCATCAQAANFSFSVFFTEGCNYATGWGYFNVTADATKFCGASPEKNQAYLTFYSWVYNTIIYGMYGLEGENGIHKQPMVMLGTTEPFALSMQFEGPDKPAYTMNLAKSTMDRIKSGACERLSVADIPDSVGYAQTAEQEPAAITTIYVKSTMSSWPCNAMFTTASGGGAATGTATGTAAGGGTSTTGGTEAPAVSASPTSSSMTSLLAMYLIMLVGAK